MDELLILNELQKNYGIKDNELAILTLLVTSNKKLTANEISKQAKIPMGRIYDFLNMLLLNKLIQKTDETPARYLIDNFEKRIYDFLENQFNVEKEKTLCITSMLDGIRTQHAATVRVVRNYDELILESILQTEHCEYFKAITLSLSLPYFFYPEDDNEFTAMRNATVSARRDFVKNVKGSKTSAMHILLNHAYNKMHYAGKKSEFVVSKEAVSTFINALKKEYGENFTKNYLIQIKDKIKKFPVRVRITNNTLPYFIHMTDKNFVIGIISGNEVIGIRFEGVEHAKLSSRLFDLLFADSQELNTIFDTYLKTT